MPKFDPRDMDIIKQPLDFYGLNIYQGTQIKRGVNGQPENVPFPPGHALTTMRWPVAPKSLYWGPRFHHERYKLPIVITENGMAGTDWVQSDGRVHDAHRIDFTRQYLLELMHLFPNDPVTPVAKTFRMASMRWGSSIPCVNESIFRPTSCASKLNVSEMSGVNLRMRSCRSRKIVWTCVLVKRLSISVVNSVNSAILFWYSALTV